MIKLSKSSNFRKYISRILNCDNYIYNNYKCINMKFYFLYLDIIDCGSTL